MSRHFGWWVTATAAVLAFAVGCSTTLTGGSDAWIRDYSNRPNAVWRAIHVVLEELGYEVESEDRRRGTIRAVASTGQPFRRVALKIHLIERTETVRVLVHIGGGDGAADDASRFRTAATEFLANLDVRLDTPNRSSTLHVKRYR